ncbi:hypothetical protein P171DRAFT_437260 [Karstenula rhodostoma CBS 690.94]|uniref:Uncharacterized protein n=1 Tax=Karstenula rhodostoma CBS 690.94 TaxID=1392251 RepID=A0A9P4U5M8_9PLEO|nr:hypothetical protein P171DRAFT_437260 [Karstenula rhodostoma CBS 690.94]
MYGSDTTPSTVWSLIISIWFPWYWTIGIWYQKTFASLSQPESTAQKPNQSCEATHPTFHGLEWLSAVEKKAS